MGTHPYERVRAVVVTTPAGTTAAAPQQTVWTVGRGVLGHVDIVIPDGHVGLTGLALMWGGRQILPYEGGEWIIGNADEIQVVLDLEVNVTVTVLTYNTDVFPHSHRLRAYVHDLAVEVGLFAPAPALFAPSEAPSFGAGELSDAELEAVVSAAGDAFLAQLQDLFNAFLDQLSATLGGAPPAPPGGAPPATVIVPSVLGMQVADAGYALDAIGLGWTETDVPSTSNAGTVIAQDPPAGTEVDPSVTTVALQVAAAAPPPTPTSVTVPNVVGMQQTAAAQALRALGLLVSVQTVVKPKVPRFEVVSQDPRAGRKAAAGSTVTITVAKRK